MTLRLGGSKGPEGSGLPGDVWQHLGNVQMLNMAVTSFFSQHEGLAFPSGEFTFSVSLFLCHCLLLAPTVSFIYHFIYLFGGAADGQTSECSQHFFSVKQQPGTNQATFSCHHFQFGCSQNRPTKKSKLVLISTCQATSQLYLAVFLVAAWASEVWGIFKCADYWACAGGDLRT